MTLAGEMNRDEDVRGPATIGAINCEFEKQVSHRLEQNTDERIHPVETRLTDVLLTGLSEVSTSQRETMSHLAAMSDNMHKEPAYQRELSGRIDYLHKRVQGGGEGEPMKVGHECGDKDVLMTEAEVAAPPRQRAELPVSTTPP